MYEEEINTQDENIKGLKTALESITDELVEYQDKIKIELMEGKKEKIKAGITEVVELNTRMDRFEASADMAEMEYEYYNLQDTNDNFTLQLTELQSKHKYCTAVIDSPPLYHNNDNSKSYNVRGSIWMHCNVMATDFTIGIVGNNEDNSVKDENLIKIRYLHIS